MKKGRVVEPGLEITRIAPNRLYVMPLREGPVEVRPAFAVAEGEVVVSVCVVWVDAEGRIVVLYRLRYGSKLVALYAFVVLASSLVAHWLSERPCLLCCDLSDKNSADSTFSSIFLYFPSQFLAHGKLQLAHL